MKYLFAAGGTGGHIFPAIAIADEIKILDKDAEILFIGAMGRIEEKIVPANDYRLETIDIAGIDRSSIKKNLKLPVKFAAALRKSRLILKNFKPDVAVGTGGFVSGPVIYMAQRMKVPTLIQEGNSYAGKTIKLLAKHAEKVVINFDETEKYLKRKDNIVRFAHPIRSNLKKSGRAEAQSAFGFDEVKKTIFIFGGSQGARGINVVIEKIAKKLYESDMNIIWQTGSTDYEKYKNEFSQMQDRLKIFEFIKEMDKAYSASDLIICRAGITSIMEIAAMGMASILIPLPTSAENHQEMNARSLEERGGAMVVKQEDAEKNLEQKINEIFSDDSKRELLRRNARMFADAEAAVKIARETIKLAERRGTQSL